MELLKKITNKENNQKRLFSSSELCSSRPISKNRSSHPEVFLKKRVLKICSKFTGKHSLQSNFIEIALRHGCSPVNLLLIFRTPFPRNTSGGLLLVVINQNPVNSNLLELFPKNLNVSATNIEKIVLPRKIDMRLTRSS